MLNITIWHNDVNSALSTSLFRLFREKDIRRVTCELIFPVKKKEISLYQAEFPNIPFEIEIKKSSVSTNKRSTVEEKPVLKTIFIAWPGARDNHGNEQTQFTLQQLEYLDSNASDSIHTTQNSRAIPSDTKYKNYVLHRIYELTELVADAESNINQLRAQMTMKRLQANNAESIFVQTEEIARETERCNEKIKQHTLHIEDYKREINDKKAFLKHQSQATSLTTPERFELATDDSNYFLSLNRMQLLDQISAMYRNASNPDAKAGYQILEDHCLAHLRQIVLSGLNEQKLDKLSQYGKIKPPKKNSARLIKSFLKQYEQAVYDFNEPSTILNEEVIYDRQKPAIQSSNETLPSSAPFHKKP